MRSLTRIDDRLGALLVLGCDDIKAAILGGPVVSGQGNGKEECVLHASIVPEEEEKGKPLQRKSVIFLGLGEVFPRPISHARTRANGVAIR